ncbi:hypothetical protein K505DRAFT_244904 [Melanomma pulvis-pyrius CBS 109.77]|uniref:Glycosyl transferase CAP10 domain-containing protein n=1 Tax=Melanomma pulvis-pyrius CBS 109.77 TaxID=1314802 RepID=A0A6A6X9J0_9PLEO|nr:hypothetical protein K505DRAFT_244904 [Melanomma pulvis-pyrius CBS 109.77]
MARSIAISRSLSRVAILSFFIITLFLISVFFQDRRTQFGTRGRPESHTSLSFPSLKLKKPPAPTSRLDLSELECKAAFPGATQEIDEAVARGKFAFGRSDPEYKGLVQGRIMGGKLYILTTAPDRTPEILLQRLAILQQLHRAILTSPSPLPDTHFAFVINDAPKNNSWAFARPNKDSSANIWLMPHFGFWTWPPHLGPMDDVLARISAVEEQAGGLEERIDKAIWRGTPWFNPLGHPLLRQDLLRVSKNRPWADIQALNISSNGTKTNSLRIEEFCKYKYVVYTEGVTYSGRLPYHQACGSVLLMAPLTWLTTTARLMRPVDAEMLLKHRPESVSTVRPLLSTLPPSDWRHSNALYVYPNFSNLEQTILFLRKHPEIAKVIAKNQRDMVVGGGYLSGTAETCYWRALIHGWASVAVIVKREWGEEVGERFESWVLREIIERR